jgi:hypothetical protein
MNVEAVIREAERRPRRRARVIARLLRPPVEGHQLADIDPATLVALEVDAPRLQVFGKPRAYGAYVRVGELVAADLRRATTGADR